MADMERLIASLAVRPGSMPVGGRPLEELMKTNEILSGAESQRLRTFFSSNCMEPSRDLDVFGGAVMMGDLDGLRLMHAESVARYRLSSATDEAARASAAQEIYRMRWGPTRVTIYNLVLLCTLINPSRRTQHLQVARWLIDEVKVPVDGVDLSGSTALHTSISTKPAFDPEYAQMLYDAGGVVTHRNRYGGTPAHEITMIWDMRNKEVVRKAAAALKWFLEHGGNLDIKDSDGQTARKNVEASKRAVRGMQLEHWKVVDDEDRRRKRLGDRICTFCGREPRGNIQLLACSRCKTAKYCSPGLCQKGDWPHHKTVCKPAAV
ncbi:hypothetical protein K466DRAFT_510948 [Polyporus arcularius HHB13444]|uniref:MYND-type domain-containing protein n=1 Tax=Polyporus arcularius HHB13444 TaxID=1314778 RepID=A0A5C3Q5S8_9APHY|nr:hypothetical protein K466DRAFT_510948 [Polyporus arcularius HHB13444]